MWVLRREKARAQDSLSSPELDALQTALKRGWIGCLKWLLEVAEDELKLEAETPANTLDNDSGAFDYMENDSEGTNG